MIKNPEAKPVCLKELLASLSNEALFEAVYLMKALLNESEVEVSKRG